MAELEPRDGGLRELEAVGELDAGEAGALAKLPQRLAEALALRRSLAEDAQAATAENSDSGTEQAMATSRSRL